MALSFPTLTDLQNGVWTRLNEASNSIKAALMDGTTTGATITSADQITTFLNDGAARLARAGAAVRASATYTLPIGKTAVALTSLDPGDGSSLFAVRALAWNGTALTWCVRSELEMYFPSWQTDANGTPLYWFVDGAENVGVYPRPSAAQSLSAEGFAIPAPAPNSGAAFPHLPPDLDKALMDYAAWQVAMKNNDDNRLAEDIVGWRDEFLRAEAYQQSLLSAEDRALLMHFALPTGGK